VRNAAAATLRRLLLRADARAAMKVLGEDHPLARTLALRSSLLVQLLTASVPVVFALVGLTLHVHRATVVLGAAVVVVLGLCAALLLVRQSMRERAQELIAAGHERVPLQVVERERKVLASRGERERLANALDKHLEDVRRWRTLLPATRPLPGVHSLRFTTGEARNVIALLRSHRPRVRGVAAARRFLTDGRSSLFSGDVELLRGELVEIADLLRGPAEESHDERVAA
jgi:hypothetical protein